MLGPRCAQLIMDQIDGTLSDADARLFAEFSSHRFLETSRRGGEQGLAGEIQDDASSWSVAAEAAAETAADEFRKSQEDNAFSWSAAEGVAATAVDEFTGTPGTTRIACKSC